MYHKSRMPLFDYFFYAKIAEKFNLYLHSSYWCFDVGWNFWPYYAPSAGFFLMVSFRNTQ